MTAPRWEIVRSIDGLFFARFIARNGRKVCVTETYTRKHNAYKGIDAIERACQPSPGLAPIFDLTVKR